MLGICVAVKATTRTSEFSRKTTLKLWKSLPAAPMIKTFFLTIRLPSPRWRALGPSRLHLLRRGDRQEMQGVAQGLSDSPRQMQAAGSHALASRLENRVAMVEGMELARQVVSIVGQGQRAVIGRRLLDHGGETRHQIDQPHLVRRQFVIEGWAGGELASLAQDTGGPHRGGLPVG